MAIPLHQALRVGAYVVKQHLIGRKRYPLVLMLEPLFLCNLACAGCGKIDYPAEILNQRLSVDECLEAVDECGAPVVVIAGGEPLLHKELDQVVQGVIARKKYVIVCTNALLLEKKMEQFKPNKYFTWSVHLDGNREVAVAIERHVQDFGASISGVMTALGRAAEEMRGSAVRMSESSEATRSSAQATATGTRDSVANLGAVAAATEQLSASVGEVTQQVGEAAGAARDAVV